tara:strand:+ start:176 stop:481 length:306 start_codon:yes stop_codon:yes gene_type:complete
MPRLEDFRQMIDGVDDLKVLESGQVLLREMIQINELKRKLHALETGLTDGGKAIFYFFAEELDEDEIVFAAERISGKIKRLERRETNNPKESSIEEEDSSE